MTRLLSALAGLLLTAPAGAAPVIRPALAAHVEQLVGQLSADDFRARDAAQAALVRLGPEAFDLIDRLPPPRDPEAQVRLGRVRREVLGFLDDIRAGLAATPFKPSQDTRPQAPEELLRVVRRRQPRSGDLLLSIAADAKHPHHAAAVEVLVRTWDTLSARQAERYVRDALTLAAFPRDRYPRGVEAGIEVRYWVARGWTGWPDQDKFKFTTRTQHLIDGRPVGKPYSYAGPGATTGWPSPTNLSVGRHTVAAELTYDFTQRGERRTGTVKSAAFAFEVTPADGPNDLVAPADDATDRLVRKALQFADWDHQFGTPLGAPQFQFGRLPRPEQPSPSVMWQDDKGKWHGIVCPRFNVAERLPVDLCFDAELIDVKAKKSYPCGSLVRLKGEPGWGYVTPREPREFVAGRTGGIQVEVVLTPSRKWALYDPRVTKYFPGVVRSGPLTATIVNDYKFDQSGNRW